MLAMPVIGVLTYHVLRLPIYLDLVPPYVHDVPRYINDMWLTSVFLYGFILAACHCVAMEIRKALLREDGKSI